MAAPIVFLEEETEFACSEEEVLAYAKWIGIDEEHERDLLHIAEEGLTAALPVPWRVCQIEGTEDIFYLNTDLHESVWEHPNDEIYRNKVAAARLERSFVMVTLTVSQDQNKVTVAGTSISGELLVWLTCEASESYGDVEDQLRTQIRVSKGAVLRFALPNAVLLGFSWRSKCMSDLLC